MLINCYPRICYLSTAILLIVCLHGRYTVNLVVFFVDNKLPGTVLCHISTYHRGALQGRHFVTGLANISAEMPDRTNGVPLLPLSTKEKEIRLKEEKDSKLKDEFHKLLNGNHGDPTDRVTSSPTSILSGNLYWSTSLRIYNAMNSFGYDKTSCEDLFRLITTKPRVRIYLNWQLLPKLVWSSSI
jgi:hypothetical protein